MAVTDDETISIVDRRGKAHAIPISDIQAAKVSPP